MSQIHVIDGLAQERRKYQQIWSLDDYRETLSPGVEFINRFMAMVRPTGGTLIDIGCGSGKAGLKLCVEHGFDVWWHDLTDTGLDPAVPRDRFVECAIWQDFSEKTGRIDYGYCADVLEHIPVEFTMLAIEQILKTCDVAWLHICNRSDNWGKTINESLHLTVQPYAWWLIRIATIGKIIDARDLCGSSAFVVTR